MWVPTTKKWCKECGYKNRVLPVHAGSIKPGQHLSAKTEFKNGHVPWDKGQKGLPAPVECAQPGEHRSPGTEFTSERAAGEGNNQWLGDDVGYYGLHTWVSRRLGKASKCVQCGATDSVEWSNISWEYKLDASDWQQLCRRHHIDYDLQNWGAASRMFDLRGTGARRG